MEDRFLFRAWLPEEKRMVYDIDSINFVYPGHIEVTIFNKETDWFDWFEFIGCTGEGCVGSSGIILMQSTGRKDNNSKLIFEGDIVSILENSRCLVYWPGNGFSLGIIEDEQQQLSGIYNSLSILEFKNEMEIVGNKYENPELLKQTS